MSDIFRIGPVSLGIVKMGVSGWGLGGLVVVDMLEWGSAGLES